MTGPSCPRLAALLGVIRHPGLTLSVADQQSFAATVRDHADLPGAGDTAPA